MVGQPHLSRLRSAAGLRHARRNLEVAALAYPDDLSAYPERVAHVLEGLRAGNEIEEFVREWIRLPVANIALDPSLLSEILSLASLCRRKPSSGFVWFGVYYIVCAIEASRPPSDVENQVIGPDHLQNRVDVRLIHPAILPRRSSSSGGLPMAR